MRYYEITEAPRAAKKAVEPNPPSLSDIIHTPEFKAWFGNSKVVNPDGSPKICIHAAGVELGPEFRVDKQRFGMGGYGFYFTDMDGANRYSDHHDKHLANRMWDGTMKAPNQVPVFLKMEKPLVVDNIEKLQRYLEKNQVWGAVRGVSGNLGPEELSAIEKLGFDGVITSETLVAKTSKNGMKHAAPDDARAWKHPVYIVYKPNQIKSIWNKGSFSPESGNISEQDQ